MLSDFTFQDTSRTLFGRKFKENTISGMSKVFNMKMSVAGKETKPDMVILTQSVLMKNKALTNSKNYTVWNYNCC